MVLAACRPSERRTLWLKRGGVITADFPVLRGDQQNDRLYIVERNLCRRWDESFGRLEELEDPVSVSEAWEWCDGLIYA
jgi:hypothetical protein